MGKKDASKPRSDLGAKMRPRGRHQFKEQTCVLLGKFNHFPTMLSLPNYLAFLINSWLY